MVGTSEPSSPDEPVDLDVGPLFAEINYEQTRHSGGYPIVLLRSGETLGEEVVVFATDRERRPRSGGGRIAFGNSGLPAGRIDYGTCRVAFPAARTRAILSRLIFKKKATVRDPDVVAAPAEFYDALRSRLADANRQDIMIFVHGVATTFRDAIRRTAQLRRGTNFPGVAMAYSWPSRGRIAGYLADYDRVGGASRRLRRILQELLTAVPSEVRVHLIGHSLGCYIIASAVEGLRIEQTAALGEVILAAPDISRLDYPDFAGEVRPRVRRVTVYTAPADRALWLSALLRFRVARVGSHVRFAVHPGIEAIDVSAMLRNTLFGDQHGYLFETALLAELRTVLDGDEQLRARLEPRQLNGLTYYVFQD